MNQPQFGARLRALRVQRGLSQAALAGDLISTGYLSRLESGARQPTPRVTAYLAERLEVPESAFGTGGGTSLARALASAASDATDSDMAALAAALRHDDGGSPELRWQALWILARAHGSLGERAEQLELLRELKQLTRRLQTPELDVRANTALSQCSRELGDIANAREYALEAVAGSDDLSVVDRADALHALISADAEAGRLAEAREHVDALVKLTDGVPGTAPVKALWASATVSLRQGDHLSAVDAVERALDSLSSQQDLQMWMRLRLAAASLYLQDDPPRVSAACGRLDEVAPLLDLIGTPMHKQELLTLRALVDFTEGHHDQARHWVELIEQSDMRLSFRDRVRLDVLRARLRIADGDVEGGAAQLRELAGEAQDARNTELVADIWRALADALTTVSARRDPSTQD